MFKETIHLSGKMFIITLLFLSLNITSVSWADKPTNHLVRGSAYDLITQVSINEFAQTADVTIKLEKNIPQTKEE